MSVTVSETSTFSVVAVTVKVCVPGSAAKLYLYLSVHGPDNLVGAPTGEARRHKQQAGRRGER